MPGLTVVTDDGVRLAGFRDGRGDAPAILFINSLGCDHRMWDRQVRSLADRFSILRYDARGHGRSGSPTGDYDIARLGRDALAVLDSAGIARAHLCGLSLGGLTAQWLALNAPERVDRLVLANTTMRIGSDELWRARQELVSREGMAAVADLSVSRFFSDDFRRSSPDAVAAIHGHVAGMSPSGYSGACEALRHADFSGAVSQIAAPALVIAGTFDLSTPPAQGRALAGAIPGAAYVELPAAHLSNIERSRAFTDEILKHLGS